MFHLPFRLPTLPRICRRSGNGLWLVALLLLAVAQPGLAREGKDQPDGLPAELRVAVLAPPIPAPKVRPGMPSGNLSALDEDLALEICRRLNVRCRIDFRLFADILPAVEKGEAALGLSNFQKTPERLQRVDFSAALWRSSSRLVGRRHASPPGQQLEHLRDVRIAAVNQSQQHRYLQGIATRQRLQVVTVDSMSDGLAAVRGQQADYCLVPMFNAYALLAEDHRAELTFVGPPLTGDGLGGTVHIALGKGNEALRRAVDQALLAIRQDGTFARLMRRHFPVLLD